MLRLVGWRWDGKQLWYSRPDGTVMGVDLSMSPAFRAGEPVPLFKVPSSTIAGATDGRRFLLAVPSKRSTQVPITVVLNWPHLIKK